MTSRFAKPTVLKDLSAQHKNRRAATNPLCSSARFSITLDEPILALALFALDEQAGSILGSRRRLMSGSEGLFEEGKPHRGKGEKFLVDRKSQDDNQAREVALREGENKCFGGASSFMDLPE